MLECQLLEIISMMKNEGFEFDIATPTGKPVVFEMWAFPEKDEHVKAIYNDYKSNFDNPKKLEDFVNNSLTDSASYAAVFVPGGHGAMLGIPEDKNVGKILNRVKFRRNSIPFTPRSMTRLNPPVWRSR
mgnify:CR=1 FL=1